MLICLAQEDKAFCYFREVHLHDQLSLKRRSHLYTIKATHRSPWCWGKFSFLYDSCGYFKNSFLSFMGLSPLSVFSKLYFMVEVCWLITQNRQYSKLQQIFLEEQKQHVKQFVSAFLLFSWTSPVNHIQIIKMKSKIHGFGQVFWNTEVLIWKFHQPINKIMILHRAKVKKTSVIWIIPSITSLVLW